MQLLVLPFIPNEEEIGSKNPSIKQTEDRSVNKSDCQKKNLETITPFHHQAPDGTWLQPHRSLKYVDGESSGDIVQAGCEVRVSGGLA